MTGGRRYNCGCGKKRYRDERSALDVAAIDQRDFGGAIRVYRCPGGLAWHLTAHGFTPEALRSVGRRLAYELLEHGEVSVDEFRSRALGGHGAGSRRWERVARCAAQMVELGLARSDLGCPGRPWPATAPPEIEYTGRLQALDRDGLARVVQVGLDAYAEQPLPQHRPQPTAAVASRPEPAGWSARIPSAVTDSLQDRDGRF